MPATLAASVRPTRAGGSRRRGAVLEAVGGAVVGQQVEERLGREAPRGRARPRRSTRPASSSSRATAGPDGGLPHDGLAAVVAPSSARCRPRGTGTPRAAAPSGPRPVTHVPAHVLPVMRSPRVTGSGRAGRHHVARADLDAAHPDRRGRVEAGLVQHLEDLDELVAEPVLERDPPASTHRGTRSTSSCSTFTHSTGSDAVGEDEGLGLAERRRGEPAPVALVDHGRVEALLDRRPDAEGRSEVVALDLEVGAVADADLVDLAEQRVGRVAGEHVGDARARPPCRPAPADPSPPTGRPARTGRRRASRRSPRGGGRGGGCDRLMAMSR